MQAELIPILVEMRPEFEPAPLVMGESWMDGGHSRGPFGGGTLVGLLMDDWGGGEGRPRCGRRCSTNRVYCRLCNVSSAGCPPGETNDVSSN